jgi:hypothetical protein
VGTASIIRAMMMDAIRISETSVYFNEATSQKAVVFILATVNTWHLTRVTSLNSIN